MSPESKAPRLLAVMAHPDDCEILVGGTLFQLKDLGWELGIVTMTAGDCGSLTIPREELARTRHAEAQAAADYLGAWYGCAGLMDVEVFCDHENLRRVVDVMRRFDPDVVITQSPVDYMLDHEEASRLARGASFALSMPNYETRQAPPASKAGPPRLCITPIPSKASTRKAAAFIPSSTWTSARRCSGSARCCRATLRSGIGCARITASTSIWSA